MEVAGTRSTSGAKESAVRPTLKPKMLNHAAYVTHDIEATVRFYTDVLGMPVANVVMDDHIPSTGDPFPYLHVFFRMADGSTLAFFECPGLPKAQLKGHPAYEIFDHIALEVENPDVLSDWVTHLKSNGLDVLGPINHEDLILSIYFHDPNGHRLELTTPLDAQWNAHGDPKGDLDAWIRAKKQAQEDSADIAARLIELVATRR